MSTVGLELIVSVRRDPNDRPDARREPSAAVATCVTLNGTIDDDARHVVVAKVAELLGTRPVSVLIEIAEVRAAEDALRDMCASVAAFRREGHEVQVGIAERELYDIASRFPDARDWLVPFSECTPTGPRRSVHLDRPGMPEAG